MTCVTWTGACTADPIDFYIKQYEEETNLRLHIALD